MEKLIGQIKVTETDSGYRIDVEGKDLKGLFSCCGVTVCCCKNEDCDCCGPKSGKK